MTAEQATVRSEGLRIARNSALLGAGQAVGLVLGFATTILVTDRLGDLYGVFIGAQRFVGLFIVIVQFGLHPLLVRAIASQREEPGSLLGTVFALRILLGIVFTGLVLGVAILSSYLPEHRWLLAAFIGIEVGGVLLETFVALCQGLERMGRAALIGVTRSIVAFVGVVSVLSLDGGLTEIVAVYLVARVFQFATAIVLTRTAVPSLTPRVDVARFAPLMREALPYLAVGYGYMALRSLDVVMLTRLSTISESARYGAALNFLDVLFVVPLLVQRALLPAFSRLEVSGGAPGIARSTIQIFYALLLPAGAGLACLADQAVGLYRSGEFADSALVVRLLAAVFLFLPVVTICATHLTGAGRLGRIIRAYLIALPTQVLLNALFIPGYGAVGACLGTLTAYCVLALGLFIGVRDLGVRMPWNAIFRHILATLPMAFAVWSTRALPLPFPVLAGAGTYCLCLYALVPRNGLEKRVLRVIHARLLRR